VHGTVHGRGAGVAFIRPSGARCSCSSHLGLGLALPFLLIGFVPALASRLPKPGAWMETFKQVLAFPMYAHRAWLLWVLGKQRGVDAIGVGAGPVVSGTWPVVVGTQALQAALRGARIGRAADPGLLAPVWVVTPCMPRHRMATPPTASNPLLGRNGLAEAAQRGRTVFVNMTADWCVTCKANEKARARYAQFNDRCNEPMRVYMKGDWTNVDPEITAFLQEHGAVGVPLYVVFPERRRRGRSAAHRADFVDRGRRAGTRGALRRRRALERADYCLGRARRRTRPRGGRGLRSRGRARRLAHCPHRRSRTRDRATRHPRQPAPFEPASGPPGAGELLGQLVRAVHRGNAAARRLRR
jgi:thiol-disulfide isomerase/thioredoxin